jgi:hypothetical protein
MLKKSKKISVKPKRPKAKRKVPKGEVVWAKAYRWVKSK